MTQQRKQPEDEEGLSLQDLILLLWDGKWILLFAAILGGVLAAAYLFVATPVYKVDALIQVEEKKGGVASAMFGEVGAMFDMASPAETEIEIIKSRMVLGRVVDQLKLDIVAFPKMFPVVEKVLLRRELNPPQIKVESLDVPEELYGKPLIVEQMQDQQYRVIYEDQNLGSGRIGERVQIPFFDQPIQIFVSILNGLPGQKFIVLKKSKLQAMDDVNKTLTVMEKGKKTGILSLSYQDKNVRLAADILNAIARSYVKQNVDRKSEEAAKTLKFLQDKLPGLKKKAEYAETALNEYRLKVGSIDLNAESKLILDQGVDLESKLLLLQQQKAEMLRLYKEDHPAVQTLVNQEARLKEQMLNVGGQVKKLPKTQQEILRLAQESKVAAELYNTMLENAQQLEVAKAGQIGNVRVIDYAMPTYQPVKPQKVVTLFLMILLSLCAGAGLILIQRFWSKGVEDPKILESAFGLPVYASIPHSDVQRKIWTRIRRKEQGLKLLAVNDPEDLSVESFRSLRTTLHFSMHDAPNNILLLVGPSPGIGKSFVSNNLAVVLAQSGKKVCLVDADMRRGRLHENFGMKRLQGLSDILSGKISWEQGVHETGVDHLSLITTGLVPPNPSELLLGEKTSELLKNLSNHYDLVLIDSPPLLAVADALVLAKMAGTTLMVLKYGIHRETEIQQALDRLNHADLKVKGCIFNDITRLAGGKYGNGGKYGYAYQYGYRQK